jgi:hypothetical protein
VVTVSQLLADLRARGVRVEAVARDRLRLVVPAGALAPEELDRLRPRKTEILEALRAECAARPAMITTINSMLDGPFLAVREEPGAVVVRLERYGEVWLLLGGFGLEAELVAEERAREARGEVPRPVLHIAEVPRLRGIPGAIVRAVLDASRTFPGARVIQ